MSVLGLTSGDGARATVHLNGAHVTSWTPTGAESDRLFVSTRSAFGPGVSIRGGVPVIFPQFGAEGPLPRHGFARNLHWAVTSFVEDAHEANATLRLVDTPATRDVWPFAFRAELTVRVHGAVLEVHFAVTNTDTREFAFTAALHPYFRVSDAYQTLVMGLEGCRYRDALRERHEFDESSAALAIYGEIDRVYFDAPNALEIREPGRTLHIEKRGFADAVVWNPGVSGTRDRADFAEGDEREMLCVEAAAVQHAITLAPATRWVGTQVVTAME